MKTPSDPPSSEITPENVYLNRRNFMKAGVLAGTTVATGWVYRRLNSPSTTAVDHRQDRGRHTRGAGRAQASAWTSRRPRSRTSRTTTTSTSSPPTRTASPTRPRVQDRRLEGGGGRTGDKPRVFDLDDLLKIATAEERVYRMRCVEGLVDGDPVGRLFAVATAGSGRAAGQRQVRRHADAAGSARECRGRKRDVLPWPYVEGLRLDEAMHPLTILASGLYGRALPPQDGAPVRLVVPWKYGFKGIKSIVKITLVETQPPTTWNARRSE